jgi:hypothetical protein
MYSLGAALLFAVPLSFHFAAGRRTRLLDEGARILSSLFTLPMKSLLGIK